MHIILIYCNFQIKIMSHKMLRPFIVKVSVLGYFPLFVCYIVNKIYRNNSVLEVIHI